MLASPRPPAAARRPPRRRDARLRPAARVALALLPLALAGCHLLRPARPPAPPAPLLPGPPAPPPLEPPPPPPASTSGFEADFQGAVVTLERGDLGNARLRLEALLRSPVEHALRATAAALLARTLLAAGGPTAAREAESVLDATPPEGPHAAHELVRAIVRARGPRAAEGRAALAQLAAQPTDSLPTLPGFSSESTRLALLSAWALAASAAGRSEEALSAWQRFQAGASASERAFALARAEAEAERISPEVALRLAGASTDPFLRAALAARTAPALRAAGRHEEARAHVEARAELWRQLLPPAAAPDGPHALHPGRGDPGRVGLAIPLSGGGLPLGLAVARGGLVALSAATEPGLLLALRDSGPGVAAAAAELITDERSLAVLGVPDAQAFALATRAGLPYLVLGDAAPTPGSTAYQLVHGADARVRALVQAAAGRGFRRFAILHADDDEGRAMRTRFAAELGRVGAELVAEQSYPGAATTFSKEAQALRARRFEALFVPASASRLELIAPALAVAELWPSPAPQVAPGPVAGERARPDPRQPERRPILLLATATGLSRELLRRAGRYVQGALLAPGFYSEADGNAPGSFSGWFRELYGRAPGAGDAFGFDGVNLLRTCVARGARTRAQVTEMLATHSFPGVTGTIRFGADHLRADPARVYEIAGDAILPAP